MKFVMRYVMQLRRMYIRMFKDSTTARVEHLLVQMCANVSYNRQNHCIDNTLMMIDPYTETAFCRFY